MKIGIIGCGGIAGAHISRLAKIEDVELVSFCDVIEEKAKSFASIYGGNSYTDFRRMLEEESIDACFICVPPFAHKGQEEMCIEKGIPFFVEKPVELNLEKAKEIGKKVEEKNLITGVGYVLRNFDVVDKAKEIIGNEKIGLVRGKYFGQVPGNEGSWLHKKELSGGQLVEQATHTVDIMRYLIGEVEEVFAYKFEGVNNKIYNEYNVEDASVVNMKFKNGIIGNLSCTWLWSGFHSAVEIVGKGIIITYEGNKLTIDKGNRKETYISDIDPMLEEDKRFIEAVKTGNKKIVKSDYPDGVKTLEVTIKSHQSIDENRPVKI